MCPAIFFPFHTFPGSWQAPVDPWIRWDLEAPCEALPPANPCRFMTPWNPFPMVVPRTSTSCPGTKWAAWIGVPTGSSASGETRNSATRRLMPSPAA